jgi:hypothetical protein
MDCEKVRDRFSSLWEKELIPSEEKTIREHLSCCPECQKEFERFAKTMGWLHSVGGVEVPEGFLSELYKKIEERKKAPPSGESRGKWFVFPLPFKLPAQAIAMVAIVFLVLYLTKMMPTEGDRSRDTKQPSATLSEENKAEQVLSQKAMEQERKGVAISPETPHPKDMELAKTRIPGEEKSKETHVPPIKAEEKKAEAPPSKTEIMAYRQIETKEEGRGGTPAPELGKISQELAAKEKSVVASKPPQEIIMKVSNREGVIPILQELVKQFGGEIAATEENIYLASIPTTSLSEFKQRLMELSALTQTDKMVAKRQVPGRLSALPEGKREEGDGGSKKPAKLATGQESQTVVRIVLIQE